MIKLFNGFRKSLFIKELDFLELRRVSRYVHRYGFETDEEIIENCLGNVMLIGINLPDSKNVLTEPAVEKLMESFNYFAKTDEISVAVLHGIGGNFCRGLEPTEKALEKSGDLIKMLNTLNKPLIASLNGCTTNFGFQLAVMCDIRVMEEKATAGFGRKLERSELPDFLIERLILGVGLSKAMELLTVSGEWTAKNCFDSNFVNRIVTCGCSLGQATSWAQNIAVDSTKNLMKEKSQFLSILRSLTAKAQ